MRFMSTGGRGQLGVLWLILTSLWNNLCGLPGMICMHPITNPTGKGPQQLLVLGVGGIPQMER